MVRRFNEAEKPLFHVNPINNQKMKKCAPEKLEFTLDADVKTALENYQCTVNRYNNADLSDPKVENVYFLERQIAYISLQLALAKARIRKGMAPTLDYTSFESLMKFVGQCGEKL